MSRLSKIKLFHQMAKTVPAFKDFLKQHKVNITSIINIQDTFNVPAINKINYYKKYPITKLVAQNNLQNMALVATSTSGSTGTPVYFVRNDKLDEQYTRIAEEFLNNGRPGPTLMLICFGLGVWIGGLITYQAFYNASRRTRPLTILTPGINKKEIFNALKNLAPNYKNIIIAGYPPFVKDIVDECPGEKIDLKKYDCRFIFAAESFTESFRDYLANKVRIRNLYADTMNIYGSAEFGAMAFETPTSIFIRRKAIENKSVMTELFKRNKIPTIAQYHPETILFEENDDQIQISAESAMPAFQYQIGDNGAVMTLSKISEVFNTNGLDLLKLAKREGVKLQNLPFVCVYERSDFSVTLYGLQIYPQTIKRSLEKNIFLNYLTGKFVMETAYDKSNNQYLKVNLELKPGIKPIRQLVLNVQESLVQQLLLENSEFRELSAMLTSARTKPRLEFWAYNSEVYFKSGVKQIWLKNKQT